jgi:PhnB protein
MSITKTIRAVPEGVHTITAHMVVRRAAEAADWYQRAFGAEERGSRIAATGGKFMHIEIWIGDSALMLADEFPELGVVSPATLGNTPVLAIATHDVRALWDRAVAAGARVLQPLSEVFWGDLHGQVSDPFGHRWNLAQHVRDVGSEEIARAAARLFGG